MRKIIKNKIKMTPEQLRVIEECNIALAKVNVVSTGYEEVTTGEKIGGGTKNPK